MPPRPSVTRSARSPYIDGAAKISTYGDRIEEMAWLVNRGVGAVWGVGVLRPACVEQERSASGSVLPATQRKKVLQTSYPSHSLSILSDCGNAVTHLIQDVSEALFGWRWHQWRKRAAQNGQHGRSPAALEGGPGPGFPFLRASYSLMRGVLMQRRRMSMPSTQPSPLRSATGS